jgi:mannose-6-phosphate isomerase
MEPLSLPANQPPQFYQGGAQIEAFRGGDPLPGQSRSGAQPAFGPEDWVGSTVSIYGSANGPTRLADGQLLRDAITADAAAFFGPAHLARFGANPALLVKLLDAGERLPVHCHPDRSFAATHLGCPFGKTEAWVIVGTPGPDPHVYLGFNRDVEPSELETWFANQNSTEILSAMNRIPVGTGDAIFVPAGTSHAISAGVFIAELQEPTDFSVVLEWRDFGLADRRDGQLGMSTELSLQCFDRQCLTAADVAKYHRKAQPNSGGAATLFPADADPFFRAEDVVATRTESITLPAEYSVLIVLEGAATLVTAGSQTPVARGSTVLIPYSAGDVTIRGELHALRCLPPQSH